MTVQPYDMAVFIGRFQPFHLGHASIIQHALTKASLVCILVGSADTARTHRNPFTFEERRSMILAAFPDLQNRLCVLPLEDHMYNDTNWTQAVQRSVRRVADATLGPKARIALVGHHKDNSSYYLKLFPTWGSIPCPNYRGYSSTPMREAFFEKGAEWVGQQQCLPAAIAQYLLHFAQRAEYQELVQEYQFLRQYRKEWGPGPFITTDACVIQSGHVLLVKRAGRPGKGLWALPGRFLEVEREETLQQAMLRGLQLETNIDVPPAVLAGSIGFSKTYDDPYRDPRGRIFTHASLIHLPARQTLAKVKRPVAKTEEDHVMDIWWAPLGDLKPQECFADHAHIIRELSSYAR